MNPTRKTDESFYRLFSASHTVSEHLTKRESKRTGTPAAVLEEQVPEEIVKDRFDRLLKEVQSISAEVCSVHTKTVQRVLVESVNDHDDSLVTGRMSNNLLVHFPGEKDLVGKLVDVRLDTCKGFYYLGEMVASIRV